MSIGHFHIGIGQRSLASVQTDYVCTLIIIIARITCCFCLYLFIFLLFSDIHRFQFCAKSGRVSPKQPLVFHAPWKPRSSIKMHYSNTNNLNHQSRHSQCKFFFSFRSRFLFLDPRTDKIDRNVTWIVMISSTLPLLYY